MAHKRPYTDEATRGAFLGLLDHSVALPEAAKELHLKPQTARDLNHRDKRLKIYCDNHNLPPPSLHNRAAVKPKSGRPYILSEIDGNRLKEACKQDRHHREMFQFEVAQEDELDLPKVSRTTIQNEMQKQRLYRVKPTKKLEVTDIQKAERYKIVLSRKDWTLDNWKRVVFSDEASILVGEHCRQHLISCIPEDRNHPDCIEVRYNNYSKAMFWGYFSYNFKGPCYVYYPETAKEKKYYQSIIDAYNTLQLPIIQAE
jgi:hypothetical protein